MVSNLFTVLHITSIFSIDNSQDNIDHLKDKYDEFMPFVIAFGIITVLSCVSWII